MYTLTVENKLRKCFHREMKIFTFNCAALLPAVFLYHISCLSKRLEFCIHLYLVAVAFICGQQCDLIFLCDKYIQIVIPTGC